MIPWKFILGLLLPSIPDIVATIKTLKKEQKHEPVIINDTARVQELERRLEKQLQVIEQLTVQVGKLEKVFMWTLWAAIFALVLALIALGITLFK